ncbi:hypothetical protein Q0F99_15865 [Rathayibacter oskolensis]|uniref:hypothetical protein n=1 Tax=Rathayibacter oskolensis TaxID=1891671 RepID=UPI00265E2E6E|nr:hypothetical protein [Rathayibacter oskolensis]WKK71073.1 hypothetical protein Q0F99_15865 [Rathayibacter oskolensis]
MFVITADQRDSRHDDDRVERAIAGLLAEHRDAFVLPPERTAGDEFQFVLDRAEAAVEVLLTLHRQAHWSIGLGIGRIEGPLPTSTRAARGEAYFAARRAVEAAKTRPSRLSLDPDSPPRRSPPSPTRRRCSTRCCDCAIRAPLRAGRSSTCSSPVARRRTRRRTCPSAPRR